MHPKIKIIRLILYKEKMEKFYIMINVLIIEKNFQYSAKIINQINKVNKYIRICGVVTTLDLINKYIQNFEIDIILIDIDFFKEIYQVLFNNYNNSIILISSNKKLLTQNHSLYFCNISNINDEINNIINSKNNNLNHTQLKNIIQKELTYLGYKPTLKGTKYLLETIYLLLTLENYLDNNLSRDIYPLVAQKFNTTSVNVKYNIRNATLDMYYNCTEDKLSQYLGYKLLYNPNTKDIIDAIVNNTKKYAI